MKNKRYVLVKKNKASRAVFECSILQLIVNEEEFLVVNEEFFLGIEDCKPLNSVEVLGYFDEKNTEIAFLFNLFALKQQALFLIKNLTTINPDEPLVIEVIPIHGLNFRRTLKPTDYIYLFKQKCLYKIRFSNFITFFNKESRCGEITKRQITFLKTNALKKQISNLKKTILSRKILLEKLSIMINNE